MATHYGTDGDDVIDARTLASISANDVIDARGGNDVVTLTSGLTFASGPGNDSITAVPGATWVSYAAWGAPAPIRIDLSTETAEDGYGGLDTVKGISVVHLPGVGGTVVGSTTNETVFCFGGKASIDLGAGIDRLEMYQLKSANWSIRQTGATITMVRGADYITVKNVEEIVFSDVTIRPHYQAEEVLSLVKHLSSFVESEHSAGWWYAGQYNEPQLVSYFPQAALPFDVGADGDLDFIVPMNRGYRTGVDSRYHFQVFRNDEGALSFEPELTGGTPFVAGARRADIIHLVRANADALVTIAHDTAIETESRYDIPWRFGDLTVTSARPFQSIAEQLTPDNISRVSTLTGRKTAVDAHSLAVGDINGDGMDDILVGDFGGVFALLQTPSGPFQRSTNAVFDALNGWIDPSLQDATASLLIDMALADLNCDGSSDLVVGWGHGNSLSRIFFNDGKGGFTITNSVTLPPSVYGANNSLHMRTFVADFDRDGDKDLVILQSRYEPYYGGNYLQYLANDGHGHFIDETALRFGNPADSKDTFGTRLQWTDYWQALDINKDGAMDIVGKHAVSGQAFYYLNDGKGKFSAHEIVTPTGVNPIGWADLNSDGLLESIAFSSIWNDQAGTSGTNSFDLYRLNSVGPPGASRTYDFGPNFTGKASITAKILGAVFSPEAVKNEAYCGIGLAYLDGGMSYPALMQLAIDTRLGVGASHKTVVDLIYTNVVGVPPSLDEEAFFISQLDSGTYTVASLGVLAAEHEMNRLNIDLIGLAQGGLDYIPFGG